MDVRMYMDVWMEDGCMSGWIDGYTDGLGKLINIHIFNSYIYD